MRINGEKLIWHANWQDFEAAKQLRTWIMLWKIKTWVKTEIPWDWLLLKAAVCLYVGGHQSLLPGIKLLKSGGRFFADSAVLIQQAKVMPQSALVHRGVFLSSTWSQGVGGALRCNLTGSGQLPLGTGVRSRDNWCHALPSAVSLLTLPHETQAWEKWSLK